MSAKKTRSKAKPKLTDADRHARFVEMARKVEASEKPEEFDITFKKIAFQKTLAKHR